MFFKSYGELGRNWLTQFSDMLLARVMSAILLGLMSMQAYAQAGMPLGSCPQQAFLTRSTDGLPNHLYTFDLATGVVQDQGGDASMATVNGIGFRPQDGYIWGWDNVAPNNRLVRIGANGISDLPYATGPGGALPSAAQFFAADINPVTGHYVGIYDNKLWTIDVTTNTVVGQPINLSVALGNDLAFHPTDGNFYSVDSSGNVYRVDPNTGVATLLTLTLPTPATGGFGGVFFDNRGTMYTYRANAGTVYSVKNVDGSGPMSYEVLTSSAPPSSSLDGARCPFAAPPGDATIRLTKTTTSAAGGPFSFVLTNTIQATGTVSTTAAGTPQQVDGDTTMTGVQIFTVDSTKLGLQLTIEESVLPPGWTLANAICTHNGATVGSLNGSIYTIPGSEIVRDALIECNFTNTLLPVLRLKKVLPFGRAFPSDQLRLDISGGSGSATATTTGNTNAPAEMAMLGSATIGANYTLSEVASGGANQAYYTQSYTCTNNRPGGQAPSGSGGSFQITPVADDDITCTFSNELRTADLQVVKTTNALNAQTGSVVDFKLEFSNKGPLAAHGAVMRDAPGAGLNCTLPSATANCTATGGAICPSAAISIAALASSGGVAIPTFPNGGVVTLDMQCTVTATGAP